MKDLVLVGTIYIDDGWYGDNHRVILSEEEGGGFKRKADAKKFTSKLKKYITSIFEHKADNIKGKPHIDCDERDTFISYTYVSAGPSISYKHHNITVDELLTFFGE